MMRKDAAHVVLAMANQLNNNETLAPLCVMHPIIQSINEDSLPAGKTAKVRCGEELTIDGESNRDNNQYIIIGSLESVESAELIDMIKKVSKLATDKLSPRT